MTNPLLMSGGLPAFDQIRPEHVAPAIDELLKSADVALEKAVGPDVPAEYDVLLRDVESVKFEFWDWKGLDWQDTWDTTQTDGQKGFLPSRVRITVTIKDSNDKDYKLTTQARILMQEPLLAIP